MVKDAIDALVGSSPDKAWDVIKRDDVVDELGRDVRHPGERATV